MDVPQNILDLQTSVVIPILSTNLSDFIIFTLISIETNYNLLYYTHVYCKVL